MGVCLYKEFCCKVMSPDHFPCSGLYDTCSCKQWFDEGQKNLSMIIRAMMGKQVYFGGYIPERSVAHNFLRWYWKNKDKASAIH